MVKPITLYKGTVGLNTVLDPQRLSQGTRDQPNIIELAQAVDVIVDERGLGTLRAGSTLLGLGAYHSMASNGRVCFVARNWADQSTIEQVVMTSPTTAQFAGIRSGLTRGLPVSFAFDGDRTWYTNGRENGYLEDGISHPWPDHSQADPVTATSRQFSPAPIGHLVAVGFGRVWVFDESTLWYSEPYSFGRFDKARGFFQFRSRGRMIVPVDGGLWISDEDTTYFLAGGDPSKMEPTKKAGFPALLGGHGTRKIIPDEMPLELTGQIAFWNSPKGLCIGGTNGEFFNPGSRKIKYPGEYTHGAICADETHFYQSMW